MSRTYRRDPDEPEFAPPRRVASEPESFRCQHCRSELHADASGTRHRNHCCHCLWSVHLDESPGDRRSPCRAGMEPIAIWVQPDGEWSLVHRCCGCHVVRVNRIAGDDNEYALLALAARPMALPPFRVDRLRRS
jgi:hypothetical protein